MIHLQVRMPSPQTLQIPAASSPPHGKPSNPMSVVSRDALHFDIELEERLLQDVVEEALAQGVMITRAKRLHGQELVEAASVVKAAFIKVVGKRR
ncbi:hypothetical protein A0H81_03141 [Grifola frondosa]|uniref:Uncharacterized protein n=1 Tax=Grifola frondosa TaxID=5627 RepID=A0A1C7MJM0_GRIFR|nr:hypothetical protein A0H81_03141 [Grifola frondosa]